MKETNLFKLCLTKHLLNVFKPWCEWGISFADQRWQLNMGKRPEQAGQKQNKTKTSGLRDKMGCRDKKILRALSTSFKM